MGMDRNLEMLMEFKVRIEKAVQFCSAASLSCYDNSIESLLPV